MKIVTVDGVDYHAYDDGELATFEVTGAPIPADVCICFAHSSNECVCGAWDRDIQLEERE